MIEGIRLNKAKQDCFRRQQMEAKADELRSP